MRVAALVKGAPDWRLFPLPHSNSNLRSVKVNGKYCIRIKLRPFSCLWGLDVETFFGNYF